jgi:diguanylate cyclase (GGDEF)-like protein
MGDLTAMETGKEGEILDSLVEMTRYKDVDLLEISLAKTIYELFDALGVTFFRILKDEDKIHSAISVTASGIFLLHKTEELDKAAAPYVACFGEIQRTGGSRKFLLDDRAVEIWPIIFRKEVAGFLVTTFLPGRTLDDKVISGFLSVYSNYHELLVDYQHDTLTGLLNRKTFEDRLGHLMEIQLKHAEETEEPEGSKRRKPEASWGFWLGIFDIDDFKHVNDTFGHVYGDDVLILIAGIIKQSFRPQDIKLRFGGEEFIVVIRSEEKADAVATFERFRHSVEDRHFGLAGTITVSIGLAAIDPHEPITSLVGRADQALYHAKKTGKNRLCVYEDLVAHGILNTATSSGDIVLF